MLYVIAECFKHSANLPVDSLPQDNVQSDRRRGVETFDSGASPVEKNSLHQLRSQRPIPRLIQSDFIFLVDLVTRMSEPLGQVAVVGE